MPATLTVADGRVFFHGLDELVCLDAKSGKEQWKAPRPIRLTRRDPTVRDLVAALERIGVRALIERDGIYLFRETTPERR